MALSTTWGNKPTYFPNITSTNTQKAECGEMGGLDLTTGILPDVHIMKQLAISKKHNKTVKFPSNNSRTFFFKQANRKIPNLIVLVGESGMSRWGDAGRSPTATRKGWFSERRGDLSAEQLPDRAVLDPVWLGHQNMPERWVSILLREQGLLQAVGSCKGELSQVAMLTPCTLSHLPSKSCRQLCSFRVNFTRHSF